jgi:hypothetical protein
MSVLIITAIIYMNFAVSIPSQWPAEEPTGEHENFAVKKLLDSSLEARKLLLREARLIIYVMFIETLLQYIYTELTSPKYY